MHFSFEEKLKEVKQYVTTLQEAIDVTKTNLENETGLVTDVVKELMATREAFQDFIDKTRYFSPGQSEYLIPPVKCLDIAQYLQPDSTSTAENDEED